MPAPAEPDNGAPPLSPDTGDASYETDPAPQEETPDGDPGTQIDEDEIDEPGDDASPTTENDVS